MTEEPMICCPAPETPPEVRRARGPRRLPPDLLRQASRRLQIIALIGAGLWILGTLGFHVAVQFSHPGLMPWYRILPTDLIAGFGLLESLGIYFYLRFTHRSPAFVIDLGLVHMVATAVVLGPLMHWSPRPDMQMGTNPTITWTGPVILMFAAMLPTRPWKMLVAGLLAASMDPLGMFLARAGGVYHFDGVVSAFTMHFPNYLMVGVAVVISRVVSRLGDQVSRERELGSYRLGELLGRGGMGEVYRATHRLLARPAAIKLIRPEVLAMSGEESAQNAMARFRREAEAAAALRSPHTVELYDFGVAEDDTLYFVMELLEGMDLETLVRTHGPVPAPRAAHVLAQVCDSLAEAHAGGQVHRDIKPANIHIGRLGLEQDFVKVLDFGLVKSFAGTTVDSLATAAGSVPGTPAYMAPEMVLGGAVDGRSDLYALGCVAYYLLTGRLVFEAENGLQAIVKHINDAPIPPSERTGVPLPRDLEEVVLACLAKRPADRPGSAAQLSRRLRSLALEPWTQDDAVRWWSGIQTA